MTNSDSAEIQGRPPLGAIIRHFPAAADEKVWQAVDRIRRGEVVGAHRVDVMNLVRQASELMVGQIVECMADGAHRIGQHQYSISLGSQSMRWLELDDPETGEKAIFSRYDNVEVGVRSAQLQDHIHLFEDVRLEQPPTTESS